MSTALLHLAAAVAYVAALSFGGLAAVLDVLRLRIVNTCHLVNDLTFSEGYALSVAAPGTSAVFLTLIGYQVGGAPGALVATVAWALPTNVALYWLGRTGSSRAHPRLKSIRRALLPVVGGMLLSSTSDSALYFDLPKGQITLGLLGCAVLLARPKLNPIWVVVASAAIGAVALT